MAVTDGAVVYLWRGQVMAVAAIRTSHGFRVHAHVFGPLAEHASDAALGDLVLSALDFRHPDPDSVRVPDHPSYVAALGAPSEEAVLEDGRSVSVTRRDRKVSLYAMGRDGKSWTATTATPTKALEEPDSAAVGAAVRTLLEVNLALDPEEPSHT